MIEVYGELSELTSGWCNFSYKIVRGSKVFIGKGKMLESIIGESEIIRRKANDVSIYAWISEILY
jgi:hypothetical protein